MEFQRAIQKAKILESLEKGSTIEAACKAAGIVRSTFYQWIKSDEEFWVEVKNNKEVAIKMMESAVFKTGIEGDVQAQKFWLCNMAPGQWKNQNSVNVGGLPSASEIADLIAQGLGFQKLNDSEAG